MSALAALTDVLADARDAVVKAGGLPVLAVAVETEGDGVAHGAARVLWYTSRGDAARMEVFRISGALEALTRVVRSATALSDGSAWPLENTMVAALNALRNLCVGCAANATAICDAGALPSLVALVQPATPKAVLNLAADVLRFVCVVGDNAITAAMRDAGAAAALQALLPPAQGWAAVSGEVVSALQAIHPPSVAACVTYVMEQLASPDAAAQLEACKAVAIMCMGKTDQPTYPAACAALVERGVVLALLRFAEAGAAELRCAALDTLTGMLNILTAQRATVADAGGLPLLAAAVTRDDNAKVVYNAVRVLLSMSAEPADRMDAMRTSGALEALSVLRSAAAPAAEKPPADRLVKAVLITLRNSCIGCAANVTAICDSGALPSLVALLQPATAEAVLIQAACLLRLACSFNDAAVLAAVRDAGTAAALQALLPPAPGWAAVFDEVVPALQVIDPLSVAACVPHVVEQLASPDAAAQLEACKAVAILCTGKTDQPDDPALCAALVAHGVVLALLRFAEAGAAELRCAALDALARMLDILTAQRATVADAGGLPLLAAAVTRDDDAEVVYKAVRVLWSMSGMPADRMDAMRTSGALDALLSVVRRAAAPAADEPSADNLVKAVLITLRNSCIDCVANATAICDSGALPSLVALLQPATAEAVLKQAARLLRFVCVYGDSATTAAVKEAGAAAALQALLPPATGWVVVLDDVMPALVALGPGYAVSCVTQLLELLESDDADALHAASRVVLSLSAPAGEDSPIGTPLYQAACSLLAEHGIVPALLRVSIDEHAPDVRRAALEALAALVRVSTPAELALAASGAALAALADAVRTAAPHHVMVIGLFFTMAFTQRGKAALRKVGVIPALVARLPSADTAKDCCSALWALAEDCPKNAEQVRACGGITELLAVLARNNNPVRLNSETMNCAVGGMMSLANHDALHAAFLAHDVLRLVAPVIRSTVNASTRLLGLLFIACVYSGRPDADALLSEFDVTEHLCSMLTAVQGGRAGHYLGVLWSVRETALYSRNMAVDGSRATRLADLGALPLLVALLRATDDAAAQQHLCRALCNFTFVHSLLPTLHAAGVAAAVEPFAASADDKTANAAKGALLALGKLRDATAQVAADKAECGAAAVSDVRAAGGALAGAAPHFNVFLSHKRTDAKDVARGLYTLFVLRGHTAFLDFEYREQLNDLDQVVAACDNLVFILTGALQAAAATCVCF